MTHHATGGFDRWKTAGLALAIIIVLNLFINAGVASFTSEPQYDTYCSLTDIKVSVPQDSASCLQAGGQWTPYAAPAQERIQEDGKEVVVTGYCSVTNPCETEYQNSIAPYNRNIFIVLVVIGFAVLIVGLLLKRLSAISYGLIYGGIVSMFIGTVRYWANMDEILRFVVLGLMLILLLVLGAMKFRDRD